MANLSFNASEVESAPAFEPIPAGWYTGVVDESTLAPTKGGGQGIKIRISIIDGPYINRKVYDFIYLRAPEPGTDQVDNEKKKKAVGMGQSKLKSLVEAVGLASIEDTCEFHGTPLSVKLGVTKETAEYDAGNNVKGFLSLSSGNAEKPAPFKPELQTAPKPAWGGAVPWGSKG